MKNLHLHLLLFLTGCLIALTGCTTPVQPVETNVPPVYPANTETKSPIPSAIPTETAAPTATPTPIPCDIAFDTDRDGNLEVYSMISDGSQLVNLSNNPGDDFDPAWSPDGKQIAFVSNRSDGEQGGQFIYIMNADGSEVRQLSQENESKSPDWSPDGTQIVYSSFGEIFVIATNASSSAIQLTHSEEYDENPIWSPDNSKIAWYVSKGDKRDIFVMNSDGSQKTMVTNNGQANRLEWTSDGRILTSWGWNDREEICHNCLVKTDGTDIEDAGGKGEIQKFIPYWTREGYRVEIFSMNLFTDDEEIYLFSPLFTEDTGFGAGFVNLTNNPAQDQNQDWPARCGTNHEVIFEESTNTTQPVEMAKPIIIGYAGNVDEEFQRRNNFHLACEELKIDCREGEISELINQGVSAIVVSSTPRRLPGQESAIQQAVEKGIMVFVVDAETAIPGAYNVTINHAQWVKTSFGSLLQSIPSDGEIGYFIHHPEYDNAPYLLEVLKLYPGISVYEHQESDTPLGKTKPDAVDWIQRNPNLDAIWIDFNAFEVLIGMYEEASLPADNWPQLVCDADGNGLQVWQKVLDEHPNFECLAVSNPPGAVYDATYAANYLLSGMKFKPEALEGNHSNTLYVDFIEITNQNMPTILKDMEQKKIRFVDHLMTPDEIRARWFVE